MGAANPFKRKRRSPRIPTSDSPSDQSIQDFRDVINERNPQFFDVGQQLIDRGLGTATDPLIEAQRGRGLSALNTSLARRGFAGGVAQNERTRLNQGFNERGLDRRDQSLETGFGLQSIGIQNAAAVPGLDIAQEGARNAGRGGGGGKK